MWIVDDRSSASSSSPAYYRLVYAAVTAVRNELYVDAARVAGLSDARIIGRHILSVVRAPIIIQTAIIAEHRDRDAVRAGVPRARRPDRAHLGWDAERRVRQHLQGAAAHAVAVARDRADLHRAGAARERDARRARAHVGGAPQAPPRGRHRHRLDRRRHHGDRASPAPESVDDDASRHGGPIVHRDDERRRSHREVVLSVTDLRVGYETDERLDRGRPRRLARQSARARCTA